MDDKQIIELLFVRDERALQFIDKKYGNLILHIAGKILDNSEDLEECKNDTFFAVWSSIPPNNPEFFKAYICKITRNIAIKKSRIHNAKKRSNFSQVAFDELGDCVAGGISPQENIESKELAKYLNEFLAEVNEENRMIFIRRYFFGDSIEELSARFSMRENTVSSKLSRLRKSLKSYLEEQEVYF